MKLNIDSGKQGGFTLIELIVVIVILGILAATALPKFVNLQGDARFASLKAAQGALVSTSAMLHGKYLTNPAAYASAIQVEGITVAMENGYPAASVDFAAAAGVTSADYVVASGNGLLTVAPNGGNVDRCKMSYQGADAGGVPFVDINASAERCQ